MSGNMRGMWLVNLHGNGWGIVLYDRPDWGKENSNLWIGFGRRKNGCLNGSGVKRAHMPILHFRCDWQQWLGVECCVWSCKFATQKNGENHDVRGG